MSSRIPVILEATMVLTINFPQRRKPTNGEVLQALFPDIKIITQYMNPFGDEFMVFTLNNEDQQVSLDWWDKPYEISKSNISNKS